MKRMLPMFPMFLSVLMLLAGCAAASAESGRRTAWDSAKMQTEDPSMPTRLPQEQGTKILLHFGVTVIPGILNDSETARALIAKLPLTQHMSRYSHDFCGVTEDLPCHADDEHYGWLNGDIGYATDAPYFTILFEDQDKSEIYGNQVNIGVITCPLAEIAALSGSYDVLIELDQNEEEMEPQMTMCINDMPVTVSWEDNASVAALRELAADGLSIRMSMYGGFEQVGSIGMRLPSHDIQTTTSPGDIVLYSGSQMVVFYGSNSWAYTRLGKITYKTTEEMKTLLGNGNVMMTLTAE